MAGDLTFMKRMIDRYEDSAVAGMTETKHYLTKYMDIARRIDAQSNAPNDRFLEKKVHNVFMKLDAVQTNLAKISEFIKGIQ